jgi:hypothetical protein
MFRIPLFFLVYLLSISSFAADDREDYDLDDDSLIEINDWQDLDDIRNH